MKVVTKYISIKSKGNAHIIDITSEVSAALSAAGVEEGHSNSFCSGLNSRPYNS